MKDLAAHHFTEYFQALHDRPPFPWQESLAKSVCLGNWPGVIDLPTASGKTACLDIAIFSLAVRRNLPRRIFFVVDRRVIVNEAFDRMSRIAQKLSIATDGILGSVAGALRELAGGGSACPLTVYQLRGGIYRDQSWVRSPLQPMVVTSTVDQIGSRLLFRGYGVSESSAPIHAALVANDALIILDEAHCSRAFSQTLASIQSYRGNAWAETSLNAPFAFVEMTATPSQDVVNPFKLEDPDYQNEHLRQRIFAPKPSALHLVRGRANDRDTLSKTLASQAIELSKQSGATRIAVMVNRVATARQTFQLLGKQIAPEQVYLLIGRMRPIDRDKLVDRLKPLKSGTKRDPEASPTFVVSTQCLEVGADLDFDLLITECASIDALLQRFGRLDRLGEYTGQARGCIVTLSGIADSKEPDPIYNHCLAETWAWLNKLAGDSKQVNMGIKSADAENPSVAEALKALPQEEAAKLCRVGLDAPSLLPSHLDAFAQTSPKPHAEPDVALFLHGRQQNPPDIQVVWRKDLEGSPPTVWKEIVALCPPVSAEAMPVRLDQFRRWLSGSPNSPIADSDLEGVGQDALKTKDDEPGNLKPALIWRGDKSQLVRDLADIKPNDTLVLNFNDHGWEEFGHMPQPDDIADEASRVGRGRIVLRIHPSLWPDPKELTQLLENEEFDWEAWETLLGNNQEYLSDRGIASANRRDFKSPLPYPAKEGKPPMGWVLQLREKAGTARTVCHVNTPLNEDEGNDETSLNEKKVTLDRHTKDVVDVVEAFASRLLPNFGGTLSKSAFFHDAGKTDPRFQAMLHGGDKMAADFYPAVLAKGDVLTNGLYKRAKQKSGLPEGFRHELASLDFASRCLASRPDLDQILHLIASHHGYCRPFAPVIFDEKPPSLLWGNEELSSSERMENPAHNLSSGVTRRFWKFTREFGWWGSAHLETCLRLADWIASEMEQEGVGL